MNFQPLMKLGGNVLVETCCGRLILRQYKKKAKIDEVKVYKLC